MVAMVARVASIFFVMVSKLETTQTPENEEENEKDGYYSRGESVENSNFPDVFGVHSRTEPENRREVYSRRGRYKVRVRKIDAPGRFEGNEITLHGIFSGGFRVV